MTRKTFLLTHVAATLPENTSYFYVDTLHDANVLAYQLIRLELQKRERFQGVTQKLYMSIGGFIPQHDGPEHGQEYTDNKGRTFHASNEGTDRIVFLVPPANMPIVEDHAARFNLPLARTTTNLPVNPDVSQMPLLEAVGFNAMLCGGDTLPHTIRFACVAYQINGKLMVNKTGYADHQLEHYIHDLYLVTERKPSLYDRGYSTEALERNRQNNRLNGMRVQIMDEENE